MQCKENNPFIKRKTLHKAIYLNGTAALVWKLCDGTRTVDDIAALLTENFSEPHVAHDVRQAIETLVREGILSYD